MRASSHHKWRDQWRPFTLMQSEGIWLLSTKLVFSPAQMRRVPGPSSKLGLTNDARCGITLTMCSAPLSFLLVPLPLSWRFYFGGQAMQQASETSYSLYHSPISHSFWHWFLPDIPHYAIHCYSILCGLHFIYFHLHNCILLKQSCECH